MANGGPHERRDIWSLTREAEWHPTIAWYAAAITKLQSIDDPGEPRSWAYLANIHGSFVDRAQWPSGVDDWNSCQHGSWFFLPWHRIYLHHFERIVRETVIELGGPSDWALPFWNYNPADPQTLSLPPAFWSADLPADLPIALTGANPLFVDERRPAINAGTRLDPGDVELSGWTTWFATESPMVPSFGGPRTGWTHMGPAAGQLEIEPHGVIHVRIGGTSPPGFMSSFETAGLDPIFWLHHANIDRLWEVWRTESGHLNPDDPAWLGQSFGFGRGSTVTSLTPADVIDTTAPPLSYRYEGVTPPAGQLPRAGQPGLAGDDGRDREDVVDQGPPPELVGASDEPIMLGAAPNEVQFGVRPPRRPLGIDVGTPPQYYLALENVTGRGLGAGTYGVYVDLPEGAAPSEYPDRRVGSISTFGVPERSQSDEAQDGSGVTYPFDVTAVVERLTDLGEWDPSALRVSIVPDEAEPTEAAAGEVQVGRIGLYTR